MKAITDATDRICYNKMMETAALALVLRQGCIDVRAIALGASRTQVHLPIFWPVAIGVRLVRALSAEYNRDILPIL